MEYKNEKNAECGMINENDNIEKNIAYQLEYIINKDDIINFISSSLYSIMHNNKLMKKKQLRGPNEPLYSKNIPVLSLNKYLVRIMKYTECENNTLIVAYLYIMKLIKKENFILGINNVYRLLLGSSVLAKKFLEDIRLDNSYYCNIGGLTNNELNLIEYSLFNRIDFNVNLKKEDVYKVYGEIFKALPQPRLNQIFYINNINNNTNNIDIENEENHINNKLNNLVKFKESQKEKKAGNNKNGIFEQ